MRSHDRRAAIERLLRERGSVSVAPLAEELGSSPVSIRRDLADLAERGIARRVHGGAVAIPEDRGTPQVVHQRRVHGRRPAPMIGLVVPTPGYYFGPILEGIRVAARQAGVRLVLAVSEYDSDRERTQIRGLIEAGARALIVTPAVSVETDPTTYDLLLELSIPVVLMERRVGDRYRRLDCVRSDHSFGSRLAIQHLLDAGHQGIALVTFADTPTSRGLVRGFDHLSDELDESRSGTIRMATLGLSNATDPVQGRAEAALERCLELGATGVVVHPDVAAIAFAEQARARNIDVPGGLSVVAYDDEYAGMADPPLDAVAPPKAAVGSVTMSICLERIRGEGPGTPAHVTLLPELLKRGSVDERMLIK
ncbi:MAG: substrate-binding domain-containing protein [Propioniciclava sp.]